MKKFLVCALMLAACGQVNPDTYKKGDNPTYGRSDGWYFDSSYNMVLIINGTPVYTVTADGSGATLLNGATILNDVDGEIQFADASEDISFGFGTGNTVILTSDTGVVTLDLAAVGTTMVLANDQTIVSDTDNEIQLGDGTEDMSFGFGTADTVELSSDTGVISLDLGAVGTTLVLANDQSIVSDTNNEIQFGDGSEDVSLGFATADTVEWSTDTGVVGMDFGTVGTTLTLANDQTIVSDSDNEIQFGDGGEDISLGFGTPDTVVLSSDTGVVAMDFGAVLPICTSGGSLGWAIVAGADTACNTTCTHACVFGFDDGAADAETIVACDDATADKCLCAGGT